MSTPQSPIQYFLYARKSSESEDQQVASIDSQIKELKAIAQRESLQVADVLFESQSAKAPGRPVFTDMLARISRREAQGILCWKLDRLARNPVDGGNISWMLQEGVLQRIQTHERAYCPTDNVLMMSVEFGMANQYVRDLSHNVRRGLLAKVEKGWYPGVAKPGYMNDPHGLKGERVVRPDPQRFPLVKRVFHLVLSGLYTPPQVLEKLNHEWGFRTSKHRKLGGLPLSRGALYRILTDPFYYGWFEFPKGSGNWYQGKHKPMITEEEFQRIQQLLGKGGRPRPQKHTFAYTGLIRCGECGGAITAEIKEQVICSHCKHKFASKSRTTCPKCEIPISEMRQATHLCYEYYHCTKRKKTPCYQGAVEVHPLEDQVRQLLQTLTISEKLKDWFVNQVEAQKGREAEEKVPVLNSLQEAHTDTQKRLSNLLALKISPQNSQGQLLSDAEFASQKTTLTQELRRLERKMADVDKHAHSWGDACVRTFTFACYAQAHFEKGSPEDKRTILSALGSNLTLEDKKLRISWHKHFQFVQQVSHGVQAKKGRFEPGFFRSDKRKNRAESPALSTWCQGWDDVRTLFTAPEMETIDIPNLTAL